jgi:two-component system response regulator PilR (NtrC family)
MRVLTTYRFPGNVRELENILERALTLCVDGRITAADIQVRATPPVAVAAVDVGDGDLDEQVEDIQRDAILKALEQTRYNKTAAAKVLGISFRALRYRIKKLGIE